MKKEFDIKSKFLMIIFCVTFVLFIIIFAVSASLIYQSEYQNYADNAGKRLETTKGHLDSILSNAVERSSNISKNLLVQSTLMTESSDTEFLEEYMFLDKFFDSFKEFENYVDGQIRIYTTNKNFPQNAYVSPITSLDKDVCGELERLSKNEVIWHFFLDEKEPYLSVFRRVDHGDSFLGYLEIKTSFKRIKNIVNSAEMAPEENISIISPDGKNIYGPGIEGDTNKLHFQKRILTGHDIVLSTDTGHVYRNYYVYICILALLLIVLLVVFYVLYQFILSKMTRHFHGFVESIENDENILLNPDLIDAEGDRDTLKIKKKFKELAQKLNQMYLDLEQISKEKKKVELEYMQSKINPHLLYNSLSVMKWRMFESNDATMMKLIDLMVEYYRGVLSGGSNIVTVDDEIVLIKQYLSVVKIAYSRDFESEINVSKDVGDFYIIKQILQPVVENAVMHGLNDVEGARLQIDVFRKDNSIVFKVEDNGCGMTPDMVEKVLCGKYTEKTRRHRGFGLKNTIDRIKMYYGEGFGLTIDSEYGTGTCVTITVEALDKKALSEKM